MSNETDIFDRNNSFDYSDDGASEVGGEELFTRAFQEYTPPWWSIVARLIICVLGVIGNVLVIVFILALREYKRAASHWYVLQLAIADLLFLLTLPFKVSEDLNDAWIYSHGMCKTKETILFLNYYASIIFLTLMSLDRYLAVCHTIPNFMKKFSFTITVTVASWAVSLLLCTPIIMYSELSGIDPNKCKCGYEFPKPQQTAEEWCIENNFGEEKLKDCTLWAPVGSEVNKCLANSKKTEPEASGSQLNLIDDSFLDYYGDYEGDDDITSSSCLPVEGTEWSAYVFFNFIAMFLVPFLIISVCYGLIGFRLKQSLMTTSSRAERERKKITAMCAVLVCIFVVCWLPFHAVHLAKLHGINASAESDLCDILPVVTSLLAYANAAINPYLYNFIGTFKKRFRQLSGRVSSSSSSRPKKDMTTRSTSLV